MYVSFFTLMVLVSLSIVSFPALAACRYSKHDFQSVLRCAEANDAKAQQDLADRYLHGDGVAQSATEAMRWYQASADNGSTAARYVVGYLYQRGLGIRRSDATAMEWYLKAAEEGVVDAQYNLATLLLSSTEIQQHPEISAVWYRRAAEQGDADAANNLGYLYETGTGVAPSLMEAQHLYRQSANANHPKGQYNLGRLLLQDANPRSHVEAKDWLERSAKQGFPPAMSLLGQSFAENIPPDYATAYYWFSLATAFGDPAGKVGKAIVEPQLSSTDMESVYKRLESFKLPGQTPARQARTRRSRR